MHDPKLLNVDVSKSAMCRPSTALLDVFDRRGTERQKRRIPCSVEVSGRRYPGMALDCSVRGLFVRTDAPLAPGTSLTVRLRTREEVALDARVSRRRVVPFSLSDIDAGGLGLEIDQAPVTYLGMLSACTS